MVHWFGVWGLGGLGFGVGGWGFGGVDLLLRHMAYKPCFRGSSEKLALLRDQMHCKNGIRAQNMAVCTWWDLGFRALGIKVPPTPPCNMVVGTKRLVLGLGAS